MPVLGLREARLQASAPSASLLLIPANVEHDVRQLITLPSWTLTIHFSLLVLFCQQCTFSGNVSRPPPSGLHF